MVVNMWRLMLFISLVVGAVHAQQGGGACETAWDCSLGGTCIAGLCACDRWWTGPLCNTLNLAPANRENGLHMNNTVTWGGNVINFEDDFYLVCTLILGHCDLDYWNQNSVVVITKSKTGSPEGPFEQDNYTIVVPIFAHNPQTIQAPDGTWLLFHIGHANRTAPFHVCSKTSGYERQEGNDGIFLHVAKDPIRDKWVPFNDNKPVFDQVLPWNDVAVTNPAPLILKNGTTLLYYTGSNGKPVPGWQRDNGIGLAIADNWKGPYQAVGKGAIMANVSEDPFVFQDFRGNFHMLTNPNTGHWLPKNTTQTGGHAWSEDGITWSPLFIGAFGTVVEFTDGSTITFGYRERPKIHFDENGDPQVFYSGLTQPGNYKEAFTFAQPFCTPLTCLL